MTPWDRLQALSCEHANRLYAAGRTHCHTINRRYRLPAVFVPDVIKENVDILGRADDAEMKNRIFWYITFYPDIFDACSKAWSAARVTA